MLESQVELKERIGDLFGRYKGLMPGVAEAYEALPAEVYADGALDGKTKRLMAMVAALVAGCRGCVLFQAHHALERGATVEEILEACGVAVSLGGTMGAAQVTRVVQFLEEKGLLEGR